MKVFILIAIFLLMGLPSVASAQDPASIEDLAWLSGCWATVGGEAGSGEQWTIPAGKTMFGVSRTIHNSKTVAYEFTQIRETEAGEIEFIARPSGQAEATFVLIRLSDAEVVFENLDHDFPQRIIYRLQAEGKLTGRIEGKVNGEAKAVDFPLQRIGCG